MNHITLILVLGLIASAPTQAGSAAPAHATDQIEARAIPEALRQTVLRSFYDQNSDEDPPQGEYAIARIGKTDHFIVYARAPGWCGSGGCRPTIWVKEGEQYRPTESLTVSHLPIVQLPQSDHGMPRLGISVFDKNRIRMVISPIHFDGTRYYEGSRELRAGSGYPLITYEMLTPF